MGQVDQEPDPRRQAPTVLWFVLGLIVVALFALAVMLVGANHPKAVGPAAGAPGGEPLSLAH
jgi:hypothetical protein